ncbi:hypothetical protein [Pseudomonas paeninsulae]|uniref:hypothetical protein n=1 Tax=Pseudomonas paeninsulae TaxID=3110772 RepID=UPI002D79D96D|nr:hypothetical protein [Pseudomonas sp. IT1137]
MSHPGKSILGVHAMSRNDCPNTVSREQWLLARQHDVFNVERRQLPMLVVTEDDR